VRCGNEGSAPYKCPNRYADRGLQALVDPAPGGRETEATMNETITGRCQTG